jgi:hypothetical protein
MTEGLNSRSITNLVVASLPESKFIDSFQILNADNVEKGDTKYSKQLISGLVNSNFVETSYKGAYLKLYHPELNGEKFPDVAVKILEPQRVGSLNTIEQRAKSITDQEFQDVLDIPGYVILQDKKEPVKVEDLTVGEKCLIFLAREHLILQKKFSKFILPAVFVEFRAKSDIPQKKRSQLSDGNEIKHQAGEMIFGMVQNFEIVTPVIISQTSHKVSPMPSELLPEQVDQILEFANLLESEYRDTGIYPDLGMLEKGNLCFTKNGRLVLIDTNNVLLDDSDQINRFCDSANKDQEYYGILRIVKALQLYASEAKKL